MIKTSKQITIIFKHIQEMPKTFKQITIIFIYLLKSFLTMLKCFNNYIVYFREIYYLPYRKYIGGALS